MAGMMTSIPQMAGIAGSVLQIGGGFMAGSAAKGAGQAEQRAAQFQAEQYRQNAGQAVAASQRNAFEERRKAGLVMSRALAVAAASGGGASDTTVQNVIANLNAEGAYRSMLALYQGEEKARQLNLAAAGKEFEGELAAKGGQQKGTALMLSGLGSGLTSGMSMYAKYGRGGPDAASGGAAMLDSPDSGGWDI